MGLASSKSEKNEALRLCKERKRFIKQAIDSRYALAAAHVSYIQSLKNIGIALRRYAEAEVLIESSLSTNSTTELLDKTPSHSSYPSPSPSRINEVSDSPWQNEDILSPRQISPPMAKLSLMRTTKTAAVTVRVKPNNGGGVRGFVEDDTLANRPMPPAPPPIESGSWDYFDTSDNSESFRFVGHSSGFDLDSEYMRDLGGENMVQGKGAKVGMDKQLGEETTECNAATAGPVSSASANELTGNARGNPAIVRSGLKREKKASEKDLSEEREDPSEFITHRAKDFLSSIKDIEHRFFRASESGREVARMLEANKIRVGFSEMKGSSSTSDVLAAFNICCRGKNGLVSHDPINNVTKVITWKRTTSSRSSSSRNPLAAAAAAARDDISDSGSDFVEEFCMIAGSHSCTLERLYAWERKLYDEVKASESIRKEYDRKCEQLRHQFAKDQSTQVMDKTRATVKDLHSRIGVALHSVDSISKRIEKIRDEELHPQLAELIHGLMRMWKAMLECHHLQYITISLAYHSRSSTGTPPGDIRKQVMAQLMEEIECFGLSFTNWVNSHTSYVEALNGWLQNCILQPRERSKSRRPFSPCRVLALPIFVLCRDWLAGIKALPAEELSNEIKAFLSDVHHLTEQQKVKSAEEHGGEAESGKRDEKTEDVSSNLCFIQSSLGKVLDRLNKFSEASLKMYEDIKQKNEAARVAYTNCRQVKF